MRLARPLVSIPRSSTSLRYNSCGKTGVKSNIIADFSSVKNCLKQILLVEKQLRQEKCPGKCNILSLKHMGMGEATYHTADSQRGALDLWLPHCYVDHIFLHFVKDTFYLEAIHKMSSRWCPCSVTSHTANIYSLVNITNTIKLLELGSLIRPTT